MFFGKRCIAVLPLTYPEVTTAVRIPETIQAIGAHTQSKAIARGVMLTLIFVI